MVRGKELLRPDHEPTTDIVMEFHMKSLVARFVKDESGATAIEYGLIAAGIALAIILIVGQLGESVNTTFTKVKTELDKNNQ